MIELWYSLGMTKPHSIYNDNDIVNWVKNTLGIATSVLGYRLSGFGIDENVDTAYAVWKNGIPSIVYSASYFDADNHMGESMKNHLSILMGVTLHETMHIKESFTDIDNALSSVGYKGKKTNFLMFVMNVMEDLYIENRGIELYPYLRWALSATWSEYRGVGRAKNAIKILPKTHPKTIEEIADLAEFLVVLHNQDFLPALQVKTPFQKQVKEKALEIKTIRDKGARALACVELYKFLIKDIEKDEAEFIEAPNTVSVPYIKESAPEDESGESNLEGRFVHSTNNGELSEDIKFVKIPTAKNDFTFSGDNKFSIIVRKPENYVATPGRSSVSSEWEEVCKLGRVIANGNPVTITSRKSGKRFHRLERIVTNDPKIFGKAVGGEHRGRKTSLQMPRIAVLLDCSGSMSGIIGEAVSATLGMTKGFLASGASVAVYGHTSLRGSSCDIWQMKDFSEQYDALEHSANYINSKNTGHLANNADGYAIEYVANILKGVTGKKVMIVISDGYPQAHGYSGSYAINHTRDEIEKARMAGIKVISVSIGEHAGNNGKIYGDIYDFPAENPNSATELVRLIMNENA